MMLQVIDGLEDLGRSSSELPTNPIPMIRRAPDNRRESEGSQPSPFWESPPGWAPIWVSFLFRRAVLAPTA